MLGNDCGLPPISRFTRSLSADDVVRALRLSFEHNLIEQPILMGDIPLKLAFSLTGQGGRRYWFICPSCDSSAGKLFLTGNQIGCRQCLGVKYPASRYKGMVEADVLKGIR